MSHQNITFSEEKQAKFLDIGRPSVTGIGQPCYHHWGITGIKGNMAIIVKQIGQRGTCGEGTLVLFFFFDYAYP